MNHFKFKIFAIAILALGCMELHAQKSCDITYSEGIRLQKTKTEASQQKAKSKFKSAKECYDSKEKKAQCDKQIKICNDIIEAIRRDKRERDRDKHKNDDKTEKDTVKVEEDTIVVPDIPEKKEITLSITKMYVKFNGKGKEFQKVGVICNDSNWVISDCPSWVHHSVNSANEIVMEVDRNPSKKEERTGLLTIKCEDKTVTLTIIQERYKPWGIF